MLGACAFDTVSERHRVQVVVISDLPVLERVDAGVDVAARVRGPGETDLVPRPRMGVERSARVARPQAPQVRGAPAMPSRTLGGAVVYRLNELSAFAVDQMGEPAAEYCCSASVSR